MMLFIHLLLSRLISYFISLFPRRNNVYIHELHGHTVTFLYNNCQNFVQKSCLRSARASYCPHIRALKTRILQRLHPASITEPLPYKPLTLPVMPCGPGNYSCIVDVFSICLTLGQQKTSKLPATVSYTVVSCQLVCRPIQTARPIGPQFNPV